MIDLHSHILFNIDDGTTSLEESMELLRSAVNLGYTHIACTSHFVINNYENNNYEESFEILKKEVEKQELGIELLRGNEVTLDSNISNYLGLINSINSTSYILVELPYGLIYEGAKTIIEDIMSRGYKVILAHIERYPQIRIKDFIDLYNMGVVFQINIRSIRSLTKKFDFLLKNNYVEIIGSDVHNLTSRSYDIKEYLDILKEEVGEERFLKLTKLNPQKIINNEELTRGENEEKKLCFIKSIFRNFFTRFRNGS